MTKLTRWAITLGALVWRSSSRSEPPRIGGRR